MLSILLKYHALKRPKLIFWLSGKSIFGFFKQNLINSSKPPIFWKEKPIIKKQLSIWNFNDLKNIVAEINATELSKYLFGNTILSNILITNLVTLTGLYVLINLSEKSITEWNEENSYEEE